MRARLRRLARKSSWVMVAVLVLAAAGARAHEVQPAIADLTVAGERLTLDIRLTLEAPVAGVDLEGLADTNAAANAETYDRLRALPPAELEAAFREVWPEMRSELRLTVGDTPVTPELAGVEIPPVGDPAQPRFSLLRLVAQLPPGDEAVTFGWAPAYGALVLRQQGEGLGDDAYTGYLRNGETSAPIPRQGGAAQPIWQSFATYVAIGFAHIVPKGLDHILFVLGLFFLSPRAGPLMWQVTAFTLAHTVTLALGALGLVSVPAAVVEPLIAASIVYVGVENILARGLTPWRPVVVFGFGLLHGLGFAAVLGDIGLDPARFATGLIGFNLGVELGQLAVIAAAFLLVGMWFRSAPWYRARIAVPASVAIALIGGFWAVERTIT